MPSLLHLFTKKLRFFQQTIIESTLKSKNMKLLYTYIVSIHLVLFCYDSIAHVSIKTYCSPQAEIYFLWKTFVMEYKTTRF